MENAGFQLLNYEEIIEEVRQAPEVDEEEDDNKSENYSQVKIGNNDAFDCF